MRVAKALASVYRDFLFWEKFNLSFQINSLYFFTTDNGSDILYRSYKSFSIDLTKEPEDIKIDENKDFYGPVDGSQKPMSLQDFIKKYGG